MSSPALESYLTARVKKSVAITDSLVARRLVFLTREPVSGELDFRGPTCSYVRVVGGPLDGRTMCVLTEVLPPK